MCVGGGGGGIFMTGAAFKMNGGGGGGGGRPPQGYARSATGYKEVLHVCVLAKNNLYAIE